MRIYAMRHPALIGSEGLCYGITELDVSDEDLSQTAAHLHSLLVDKPIELWLSSPLKRCVKLAEALTAARAAGGAGAPGDASAPGNADASAPGDAGAASKTGAPGVAAAGGAGAPDNAGATSPGSAPGNAGASAPGGAGAASPGAGFSTDERLREMSFGDWEGKRWDELDREATEAWMADYVNIATPGGESFGDVISRVEDLVADLKTRGLGEVALVCHAGVLRALLSVTLGIAIESTWSLQLDYGALAIIDIGQDDWQNRLVALTPLSL